LINLVALFAISAQCVSIMLRINSQEVAMSQTHPSLVPEFPSEQRALADSDDECVRKLAMLIENKDVRTLDEVARLISRLLVPIE
jgi:hypothetical protein